MSVQACNLCGTLDQELLFEAFGYPITRCRKCGLVFTGTATSETADRYYRMEYFCSARDYAESLMQKTAATVDSDREECVRQVASLARRAVGNILDVGCAAGALLAAFKHAGWNCVGVEPSREMADYARRHVGLEVYEGTLETSKLPAEFFDVVTAVHVLEHSPDPGRFIKCCRRLLRKKGLLLVEVPDFGSRQARRRGSSWIPLYPDTHLYHFTSKTLARFLHKHDFGVLRVRRCGGLGIISAQLPTRSETAHPGLSEASSGASSLAGNLMRFLYENREKFYRVPALRHLLRYTYWHLFHMNEYLRVYAVRTT